MDLTFSPQHEAFRAEARAWHEANVTTGLASMNTAEGYEQHLEWERKLFDARWAVVSWPEDSLLRRWSVPAGCSSGTDHCDG